MVEIQFTGSCKENAHLAFNLISILNARGLLSDKDVQLLAEATPGLDVVGTVEEER